jgi:hypothetical protein
MSALKQAAGVWYRHRFQMVRAEGFYDNGTYKRLPPQLSWQRGNIQPASQRDVERLPEGARADGAVTVFSGALMRTHGSPNELADRIMYNGTEYEVSTAAYWESHNVYTCTKVGQ